MFRNIIKTFPKYIELCARKTNGVTTFGNFRTLMPLSTTRAALQDDKVKVTFVMADGRRLQAAGRPGDSLLDVVVDSDLDIDGFGACEGTVTCSTCHVVLSQEDYDRLPEQPGDEERDMLDLAYGLTDTSRLGCQVTLSADLDGLEVRVPEGVNDARS